jgi:drug/metabolite transporter (DMT)-like permease
MGAWRWTIAGSLLAGYLVATGRPLPARTDWPHIALLGFLLLGLGNGGVVVAEQWIPSGLTAVLVAASPFWMTAVESALPDGERLRGMTFAGLVVGFSGIVLLVWPDLWRPGGEQGRFLAGVVAVQVASLGWSLGSAYSRRHTRSKDVLGSTAGQMLAGGLLMLVVGTVRGEWSTLYFTPRTAMSLAYLATIGSIGGFVAYSYALQYLPISFVSLYAYVNPVIAVALGVALLGEPFDSRMALAAVLVFAGVAIVRLTQSPSGPPRQVDLRADGPLDRART